jgi:hypothetical protein
MAIKKSFGVNEAVAAILAGKDVKGVLSRLSKCSTSARNENRISKAHAVKPRDVKSRVIKSRMLAKRKAKNEDVDDVSMVSNPAVDIVGAAVAAVPDVDTKEEVQDALDQIADFVADLPEQPVDTLVDAISDFGDTLEDDSADVEESRKALISKYSQVSEDDDADTVDTEDAAELITTLSDNIPDDAETESEIQEYFDDVSDALQDANPEDSIDTIEAVADDSANESKSRKRVKGSLRKFRASKKK